MSRLCYSTGEREIGWVNYFSGQLNGCICNDLGSFVIAVLLASPQV